jgi:hypothetical protein
MSTVELARESDGPGLLQALAQRGLDAELVDAPERVVVEVADCDEAELAHALEDWIRARDLPLVPVRIDDCAYAIAPPAA